MASYVLSEIPSAALRETTLASLWAHTRDTLVSMPGKRHLGHTRTAL